MLSNPKLRKSPYSENGSVESGMGKSSISISILPTGDEQVASLGGKSLMIPEREVNSSSTKSEFSPCKTPTNYLNSVMDRLTLNSEQFEEEEASTKPIKRNNSCLFSYCFSFSIADIFVIS